MLKYFLNDEKRQEVKVGDKVIVSVPTSTPYGPTKCDIEVVVTQASLRQLIKDNLVVAVEQNPIDQEDYKPLVRRLARRTDSTFEDALMFLNALKETSLYAHNAMLIELAAYVINRDCKTSIKSGKIYKVTPDGAIFAFSDGNDKDFPAFYTLEDAKKAVKFIEPFCRKDGK